MIAFILIALAGICKAVCDKIVFHHSSSVFANQSDFFNPRTSWKFKWKNGDREQGERFMFSSTWLVFTTDAWHLFQNLETTLEVLAIMAYIHFGGITGNIVFDFLLIRFVAYPVSFHVFFTYLLNRKKKEEVKVLSVNEELIPDVLDHFQY